MLGYLADELDMRLCEERLDLGGLKYSRSTWSILAAILSFMPARAAIRIARSGAFSGEMRPINAKYPPLPLTGQQQLLG